MGDFEAVLGGFGVVFKLGGEILGCFEMVLGYFGLFWIVLDCFGWFWVGLGGGDPKNGKNRKENCLEICFRIYQISVTILAQVFQQVFFMNLP